jgi:hypothetical protein
LRAFVLFGLLICLAAPGTAGETQTYTYDELGRLIAVQYSGTVNNGQAHSLCYDPAGNRTKYKSDASGVIATCPTTPPGPPNQPPVTSPDTITLQRCAHGSRNVVANDTDPEGNYPLVVTAVNQSWAAIESSTTVGVDAPDANGTFAVTYTVADSLGATATGTLSVTVTGNFCV